MKYQRKNRLILIREPNGRPQRSEEREYAPTRVKRLLEASMAGMADAEWGTAVGRLFVRGSLTSPMYAAAKRWNERVMRYHHAIGAPPPDPKALELGRASHGAPADPDSIEGRKQAKREAEAVAEFMAAHSVLCAAGKLSEIQVRSACERDCSPVTYEDVNALKRGLLWLADYWGLTNQEKRCVR